jgi:N-acetylmuramoyl-L-alanine amidase
MRTDEEIDISSDFHTFGYEDSPITGKCNKFNARKNEGVPLYIVQHHTVADYDRTVALFNANRGEEMWNFGSAHYVIRKDGVTNCMVNPEYRAYQAGAGHIVPYSKFNPTAQVTTNDLNSWSIGIENVNDGYSIFPKEQMYSNILLMEGLVKTFHTINPKILLGHADWDPSRKCDPNPYFDWELAANASERFEEIDHNFGVYPSSEYRYDSNELISGQNPDTANYDDIKSVQDILAEIGYNVFNEDKKNEGCYDLQTRNCVKAFKNHYLNTSVVKILEDVDIREYEKYSDHHPFMIKVDDSSFEIMGEVADLFRG